jgi:hypothetical protein
MQNHVAAEINKSSVTAADYAVMVSNTGDTDNLKQTLVDFGRHYGQVLAAFPLLSVGDVLTQCHKVHIPFYLRTIAFVRILCCIAVALPPNAA